MGKNTVQPKQGLCKCYTDSGPSRQIVEKWFSDFKLGCTNTDDAERSGRLNSAVVPENIKKVHKMVLADRKIKLREIADTLKISEGSFVWTFEHEKVLFEMGIAFAHSRSKTTTRRRFKALFGAVSTQQFWDAPDILFIRYLEKGRTINSEYYIAPLVRSKEEIAVCRPKTNAPEKEIWLQWEVIAETEPYFEVKDKSFYKKGTEMLEKRWNECITLEGDYVEE